MERDVKAYHSYILSMLMGLSMAFWSRNLAAMTPVLPLPKPLSEIPMLFEAVRDPDLAFETIADDADAARVKAQATLDAEALLKEGSNKASLLQALMKANVRLSYYYEDVRAGRLPSTDRVDVDALITRYREEGARRAAEYLKLRPEDQAQALYIIGLSQARADSSDVGYLTKNKKALGKDRANRAEFLSLIRSGGKDSPALRRSLTQLMNPLGASGQVAAHLYLARLSKDPSAELAKAVAAATRLPRNDRENAVAFALQIWTEKTGKVNYAKLPFDLKGHSDLFVTRAIKERAVLSAQGKNPAPILQFYRSIIEVNRGTPLLALVLERVLEIEESVATSTKVYSTYEKALISAKEMTSDKLSLGKGQEANAQAANARISQRYRGFVSGLISQAKAPKATKPLRAQTIAIVINYVANYAPAADKVNFKTELGRIYAINDQHAEAVRTFMDLKKNAHGPQAQEFLALAISSQRVLADWPQKAPWAGVPKKNAPARTVLAGMYEERFSATNNWDDLAHHGLLLINVNSNAKAFQAWTKNLEKNPSGPHAQLAAGMMMLAYQGDKAWQKLEDVARLAIKAKLTPLVGTRSLDSSALLADALFEGGREHYSLKRYAQAHEKLAEFVKKYRKDSRRPEALFTLAKAYHSDNRHPPSIEALLSLINDYPGSTYEHDALLFGGDWTVPMAWEDQTIFFYQRFIERFAKDPKVPTIRLVLAELYMGRELYGNAVRLHAQHVEDVRVTKRNRIESALAIMAIEERYGDAKYAVWGASKAREISGQDPIIVARVVSFDARRAAKSGDANRIRSLEAQLSKLGVNERGVIESLAQLRYLMAEKQAVETKQEIFNLAQTNPLQTLNAQYQIFQKTAASYDRVCSAGVSTYCGLAMLRLSETMRDSLASIENLSIAQTLDEKTVRTFENQKLGIINSIGKTAARADAIALGISEKGETTPEWSQEIVVNNSDNSLERSHGATGSGYVQFMLPSVEK
jgi:hypothetical protein